MTSRDPFGGTDYMVFVANKPVAQFTTSEQAAYYINRHAGVLPNARILKVRYRPDPCWITVDGRVLAYEEIQDDHLVNILHRIANGKTGKLDNASIKALIDEATNRICADPQRPLRDRMNAGVERIAAEWPKIRALRQVATKQSKSPQDVRLLPMVTQEMYDQLERDRAEMADDPPDDRYGPPPPAPPMLGEPVQSAIPRLCNASMAEIGREAWCVLDVGHPGECSLKRARPGTLKELEAGADKAKAAREKKQKPKIEDENTRRLKALADELTEGGDK